jgi:putative lipase involved disintegration of autophagic bodies
MRVVNALGVRSLPGIQRALLGRRFACAKAAFSSFVRRPCAADRLPQIDLAVPEAGELPVASLSVWHFTLPHVSRF